MADSERQSHGQTESLSRVDTEETSDHDEPTSTRPSALERFSSIVGDSTMPDPQAEDDQMSRVSSGPAYSTFSPAMKTWITVMLSVGSFISPMTANIYFPALNPIAEDLGVSLSLVNLTLTTYMIFQGLAPTLFGDFGDMAGRRPAYIVAFTIYLFANIGLALQRNYAALMVLRCVQSFGSSGTIALGFAMVADIAPPAERGRYIGYLGAGINVGPAIGPFLGGILSQYLGWPSLFWFLAIVVTVWLVPWILTVPETCRNVVGNGSTPAQSWNLPVIQYFGKRKSSQEHAETRKLRFPNPIRTLAVVFEKEMGLILILNSLLYVGFILTAATLGTQFKEIYGYNDLQVGLCYLPYGGGSMMAVIAQGYILDWNYRRIAKKAGITISRRRGDDLRDFPIETARLQPIYPAMLLGAGALVGYGWALQVETSVAAPLILSFLIGVVVPTSFQTLNTLIVDIFPKAPATATAANNLVRCLVGAAGAAVIELVIQGIGRGWTFTIMACLVLICVPGLLFVERHGPKWRKQKLAKTEAPASTPREK
ncbi:Quinidine resistance protein-like protein [Emericellopsis cladophorae]|uniref:Quinidine resistance protein-like protein n=1 Tax=Emericellopsis cladophorae TaxID=2686198 RepID=A0A9Q0BBE3_9HYPO|nr:Quinidine resistance protein-like protein [Emericellopsis cladophorae]KAI6777964.1 Quinidine resistance protein-like protein [Emericellopsis cladophorae]